ncbi:hypothetical protein BDV39DRAFT_176818 [Aspergillus sergii]|uniref:Uncharacterized protein n=1 Tax=Aspergillus sergii TaxID=1034303 RepID=A0A5N6X172_9EURO|nr:hypothetical protein BDV39DRAFT_176818 [Aspergillus sergii]
MTGAVAIRFMAGQCGDSRIVRCHPDLILLVTRLGRGLNFMWLCRNLAAVIRLLFYIGSIRLCWNWIFRSLLLVTLLLLLQSLSPSEVSLCHTIL